jgi:hypothetical protein
VQIFNLSLTRKAGFFLIAALAASGFLIVSISKFDVGFPLDDAWIHQTYARNLIEDGTWSFTEGEASGGSTSPLWTVVMGVGFILKIDPKAWSYFVGILLLGAIGILCVKWGERRQPLFVNWGWLVVLLVAVEWHLTWAAVSGMETLAICLMILLVFWLLEGNAEGLPIGLLLGIAIWLRPGAITLLLPVAIYGFHYRSGAWVSLIRWSINVGIGLLALLVPYLLFNFWVTGTVWPNTFYAKQAEYAILQDAPILDRFVQQLIQPMIGVGIVLFPGIFLALRKHLREHSVLKMAPLLWVILHWLMYAWRLPATYQHGRYAIPTIPVLLVLGLEGFFNSVDLGSAEVGRRIISRTWALLAIVVALAFYGIGARAYATDVAIIETEMVQTAKWIAENTEKNALIAAHDIGALGFYGQREILDLAGLISPEVIPFIRDEAELANYLDQRSAQFLMTFPDWYPELSAKGELIYTSEGAFSPLEGGENMAIYRWR